MNRLASQARLLQRQIFASLPFGHRLAAFYLRLASDPALFGRIMLAEFLRAGVTGLDLPAVEIDQVRTDYRKLPPMVGRDLGKIVYQRLYKLIQGDHETREQVAQDIMTNWLVRVMDPNDRAAKCRPGIEARQAYGWLHFVMKNAAQNHNRGTARDSDAMKRVKPTPTRDTDSGPQEIEFADPSVLQAIIRDMPRSEWSRLEQELLDVMQTPEQQKILDLKLEGWTNAEVADELGISGAWVGQVLKKYQPQLTRTIQRYL